MPPKGGRGGGGGPSSSAAAKPAMSKQEEAEHLFDKLRALIQGGQHAKVPKAAEAS
jgi:hypothetical protein